MQWSTQQKRMLQYFVAHQDREPAVSEYGWKLVRVALLWMVAATVTAYCGFAIGVPGLAWWGIGFFIGATMRDIEYVVSAVRNWPLVAAVTDWAKVSKLAAEIGIAP